MVKIALCALRVQEQCCGVDNYTDFVDSAWYNKSLVRPLALLFKRSYRPIVVYSFNQY